MLVITLYSPHIVPLASQYYLILVGCVEDRFTDNADEMVKGNTRRPFNVLFVHNLIVIISLFSLFLCVSFCFSGRH